MLLFVYGDNSGCTQYPAFFNGNGNENLGDSGFYLWAISCRREEGPEGLVLPNSM